MTPYVKGVSEKFKHIGIWFNVRTVFKTKQILCGAFMRSGGITETDMKQCVITFDVSQMLLRLYKRAFRTALWSINIT